MSPLEVMVLAKSSVEPHGTRVNKLREDGKYHEVFYHSDPDVVSPVVVAAYVRAEDAEDEASRLTDLAEMRAALLALAKTDGLQEVAKHAGLSMWVQSSIVEFQAMARAIAEGKGNG